ncbi:MAG: di-trans,poly-cis-decaprenylcistransferase, partial [Spirochaetaceae bacterium]|nr:di-trans,poly-cis-decaprenylcistransferase [Spirochaetaceae bacterium]
DGNGRWAQKRGLPRTSGHKEGLETAKKIVSTAVEIGIKYITLYTFSTENWKRTQEEVGFLMGLITKHLSAEYEFYKKNGIKIQHIGNIDGLPQEVKSEMKKAEQETKDFTKMTVVLAINYGGRDELVRAFNKIKNNNLDITEENISKSMDVDNLPDVDLVIRTGGEKRLSNFLLWHSAYAEFVFNDTLWPDYSADKFIEDIKDFQSRSRRFGAL